MLFNSIDFAIFLPVVFILYWFVFKRSLKWQNALLVLASYVFYGWWDWRFLSLIAFSTLVDYTIGLQLSKTDVRKKRRLLLLVSILVNLGFLGFFKYYNFFMENFETAFSFMGQDLNIRYLDIILPVGISFYTFQTMSYTIDVYRKKLEPTKDLVAFTAFVSFFPQLVAGPIERATNLLPQFFKKRQFSEPLASDGMRQILWGLFKKMVIADNCAVYVNEVFANYQDFSGSTLALGAVFFAFQIYGDFSGYSDIAIGTARLFGFNLKQNFAFPYFSRDIAEFWRRWHISLSTWFRDYVYIPLGGSRVGRWKMIRNTFIIFLVSGFWHGANWTFIAWGGLNAIYFLPLLLTNNNRKNMGVVAEGNTFIKVRDLINVLFTFGITVIAWVFFRADSISDAGGYLSQLFLNILDYEGAIRTYNFLFKNFTWLLLLGIILQIFIEWYNRSKEHGLELVKELIKSRLLRWIFYLFIALLIFLFHIKEVTFIYFQF